MVDFVDVIKHKGIKRATQLISSPQYVSDVICYSTTLVASNSAFEAAISALRFSMYSF